MNVGMRNVAAASGFFLFLLLPIAAGENPTFRPARAGKNRELLANAASSGRRNAEVALEYRRVQKRPATSLPADRMIPYDLVVPFWSDGAEKLRWVSVPEDQRLNFRQPPNGFFRGAQFS